MEDKIISLFLRLFYNYLWLIVTFEIFLSRYFFKLCFDLAVLTRWCAITASVHGILVNNATQSGLILAI